MKQRLPAIAGVLAIIASVAGILLIFGGILYAVFSEDISSASIYVIIGLILLVSAEYLNNYKFLFSLYNRPRVFLQNWMRKMKALSSLHKASVFMAAFLVMCIFPLPYGFYTIVRLATTILAICWAVKFYEQEKNTYAIIAAAVAVLFQPLIMIKLDRFTWNLVDITLSIILLFLVFKIDRTNNKQIK